MVSEATEFAAPPYECTAASGVSARASAAPDGDLAGGAVRVGVVVGRRAPALERFAAEELCRYLASLYDLRVQPTTGAPAAATALFLVGTTGANPAITQVYKDRPFPRVGEQGIVLRRAQWRGRPALILGGGSPEAALWAVYELVERWGVRYLLHGDVLPERRAFTLLDLDVVVEPALPTRMWRLVNDFAFGPESWPLADCRAVIDQLAKLKFNRILVSTWTYQPFLDLKYQGVERSHADLWFGFHYPITDDMVGRELFGEEEEFWNPDLPRGAGYPDFAAAGKRYIQGVIEHARSRGMRCALTANLTEFPPEFASLVPGAQTVHQLGTTGVVPGPGTAPDDPQLTGLAAAVLRTALDSYAGVDYVAISVPEWRQWAERYQEAWAALDAKYGIATARALSDVLAAAAARVDYPGGAERAVQEAKGDIVFLRFCDHLLRELRVQRETARPDVKFIYVAVAEELFPILPLIMDNGWETISFIDYTPSRILKRRNALAALPAHRIPCTLIHTLHDDNVGVLPQLSTGSLHELTRDLRQHGWAGFQTRYWLIGDHDPCAAYLSRAAWDETATPQQTYRDQVRAACGEACVEDMVEVFGQVEQATILLEWHGLGLTFPAPGMIANQWLAQPMPQELAEAQCAYRRALAAARRASAKVTETGRAYVDYWLGRLRFGISYLDAVAACRLGAIAEAQGRMEEARAHARAALACATEALTAYARIARDQSDRGAIAVMNEYVIRPLRAKIEELS